MTGSHRVTSYGTIAAQLREAVRSGRYGETDRLPTEHELAERHSVSRQTVRRAMQELVAEGLVYRVAGRGTYPVLRSERYLRQFGSVADLMGLSLDTDCEILRPLAAVSDAAAAARLRLDDDEVFGVSFVRRHDAVVFCHTEVRLPPEVGSRLASVPELTVPGRRSRVTVIGLIEGSLRRRIRDAEQSVTATTAPAEPAGHLLAPAGSPVLRIERVYFDADNRPLELAVSHFDPAHYSYRARLRRQPG
ncbi:MAG: GntR family transcriptional regulator [Nocardioidaceae bacterium]